MNLLDAKVSSILKEPYEEYGKWWVEVEYTCWGSKSTSKIMRQSKEEAEKIEVGFLFLV